MRRSLIILCCCLLPLLVEARPLGFGRDTTGGAGKTLVTVTTCADDNVSPPAGSLRALIGGNISNRYVIFSADCREAIGTAIGLNGAKIEVRGDNITIDGFRSPGGRIDIRNQSINFMGSNIIYQGLGSVRAVSSGIDAWQHISRSSSVNSTNILAFRTSARGQGDETMSISGPQPDERRYMSFLYNIYMAPAIPTHDANVLIGDGGNCPMYISMFGNFLHQSKRRNPWIGCKQGDIGDPPHAQVEFVNNVLESVGDPNESTTHDGVRLWKRARANIVNNWIKGWDVATNDGRRRTVLVCDAVAYGMTTSGGPNDATRITDTTVNFISLGVTTGMGISIQNKNIYSVNITNVAANTLTFSGGFNAGNAAAGDTYMVHRHPESTSACRRADLVYTPTANGHIRGNRYYAPHDATLTAYLNAKTQVAENTVPSQYKIGPVDVCSGAWLTYAFAGSPQRDATEQTAFANLRTALIADKCSALPLWLGSR